MSRSGWYGILWGGGLKLEQRIFRQRAPCTDATRAWGATSR